MGCCNNCSEFSKLEITADGEVIELNQFVKNIISSTITGMVGCLDGVDDPKELVIKLGD